jgi:hypothetical protein
MVYVQPQQQGNTEAGCTTRAGLSQQIDMNVKMLNEGLIYIFQLTLRLLTALDWHLCWRFLTEF